MVREFLDERDVIYEVRRVGRDAEASREFLARGWLLPPVVEREGRAVEGYDPDALESLLAER